MKVNIYCLYDPEECKVRYIGRTRKDINKRLVEHISKSKYHSVYHPNVKPNYRVNWIKSVIDKGYFPKIKLLNVVEGWKESHTFETNLIGKYKHRLVNSQDRGKGPESKIITQETKKRISETLKNKYKSNEIKKQNTRKTYIFNSSAKLVLEANTQAEASEFIGIPAKTVYKKLESNKGVNGYYVSRTKKLNLDKFLYIYNYKSKEVKLFNYKKEIQEFLNISDAYYNSLDETKHIIKGWIINSLVPIFKEVYTLTKNDEIHKFTSMEQVQEFLNCHISSIYRSVDKKYKYNKVFGYTIKINNNVKL